MGTTTMWMSTMVGLLLAVTLITVEETVRRRAACIRFQHELRRGAYRPDLQLAPGRHLQVVRAAVHRRAA